MIPGVSAGSSHEGGSEMCRAQVASPADAAAAGTMPAGAPSARTALATIATNADRSEPVWCMTLREVDGLSDNRAACQLANRSVPGAGAFALTVGELHDVDHLAEGDELRDHPGQLQGLVLGEAAAHLGEERVVHLVMIEVHAVGVAQRRLLALAERSGLVVRERRHELLGDPFAPARGVARRHSVVALVELDQAQPNQLLGAVLDEPAPHQWRIEADEMLEALGQASEEPVEVGIAALGQPLGQALAELGIEVGDVERRNAHVTSPDAMLARGRGGAAEPTREGACTERWPP